MTDMELSQNGLNFIKSFEGFSSTPYQDVAGKLSIGYGHLIKQGESFPDTGIDEEAAQELLAKDTETAQKEVCDAVTADVTQNQYDALVSFTFNLGGGTLLRSTLLERLNNGDYAGCAAEFPKWNHAGGVEVAGLTRRRDAEMQLFLTA